MRRGGIIGLAVAGALVLGVGAGVAVALSGGGDAAVETVATEGPAAQASSSPEAAAGGGDGEATPSAAPAEDGATDDSAATTPGAYVDYSDAALASAEGTRVLFFHATWCPKCRALDESIRAEGVPDGVTILKVDYDSNTALRQRYDVRQQTTLVALDDTGAATASFVAYDDPSVGAALAGVGATG